MSVDNVKVTVLSPLKNSCYTIFCLQCLNITTIRTLITNKRDQTIITVLLTTGPRHVTHREVIDRIDHVTSAVIAAIVDHQELQAVMMTATTGPVATKATSSELVDLFEQKSGMKKLDGNTGVDCLFQKFEEVGNDECAKNKHFKILLAS